MKLRNLFAVVLLLVTVVLLVAVVSGFQLYGSAVSENEMESLEATAEATATQLDALLSERIQTVELLGTDPVVSEGLPEPSATDSDADQRQTLQRFIDSTEYQGVSIIDADGRMVAIESDGLTDANRIQLLGTNFSDRTYFQQAIAGEPHVSEPVEAETGNFIVTVSVPIERDGTVVGTLNAALHLQDGSFFESIDPEADSDLAVRVSGANEILYEEGNWDGTSLITASAEKTTTGWTVTVARPESAVGGQAQTVTMLQIGAVVLVIGTLLGFALWFYQSSIRQTERVLDGFDRLSNREYGTEIDVGGTEEWSKIGTRFNQVSTELARHERELKQYREVVERLEEPIFLQDTDGRFVLLNEAISLFAEDSEDELLGKPISTVVDDETATELDERRRKTLDEGHPIQYEIEPTFERTESQPVFSVRQNPYYDDTGELAGTISIWRDVTGLKERETELTQYKRAIQEATDLICVVDTDEQYQFANPQYRSYHGFEEEELTGQTVSDVLDGSESERIRSYLERALSGAIVKFQSTRMHPTRGERTLDVRYYPLDEAGETTGMVAVLRDVTEREERAHQLRVVDRILRHNLRNDLTVIGLQAEQIRSNAAGIIEDSADEILEHANGLLTTSEKSRSITEVLGGDPTVQSVDIVPLVREAASSLADEYGIQISVGAPDELYANTTVYFRQAIEEVIENSIVHNSAPQPSVELQIESDDSQVVIRVIDGGPGIPQMDKDVLETGRTIDDLYHGSGLGLWLVYWIVHRSGGSVTVRDENCPGTVVEIRLARAGPT
ncbi:PAS domain-containing protein [Halobacteriaceae archaeon SHR40]|uniref:PAS domain-containing protein n=1 Tax=Halovenus amylolytica TaxID=2500550 RepID=UPI000FE3F89D